MNRENVLELRCIALSILALVAMHKIGEDDGAGNIYLAQLKQMESKEELVVNCANIFLVLICFVLFSI